MTMSVRRRRATLTALVTSVVASPPILASRPRYGQMRDIYGRQVGGGRGYGIELRLELLRAVGGYDTAAEKGTAPYPTGQISETQRPSLRARFTWKVGHPVPMPARILNTPT